MSDGALTLVVFCGMERAVYCASTVETTVDAPMMTATRVPRRFIELVLQLGCVCGGQRSHRHLRREALLETPERNEFARIEERGFHLPRRSMRRRGDPMARSAAAYFGRVAE